MKPRSKTSRKPLKKKQNGKRTTKKNTKKHKQTHQARSKKSRGMIGGADAAQVGLLSHDEISAQKEAEFYPLSPGALKASGKLVVVGGGVIGLIALFVITRN